MTNKKPKLSKEEMKPLQMWHHLALLHGYNELAKKSEDLGEKVFCRLGVQRAEQELGKLGITVTKTNDLGPVVLTLPHKAPHVEFYEKDIELMRRAVAKYDEKEGVTRHEKDKSKA